jgi:hypothetical protein
VIYLYCGGREPLYKTKTCNTGYNKEKEMRKEATTVRGVKSIEVQLEGLKLVAYEFEGKQFVSVEINGEYFSSFNMIDMTAGQVAYDIKSVYSGLCLADIRNAVLKACELMPKDTDTLINEVVLPEALVDDSKATVKPVEYVIVVVEENNTFYLTEIYSEDFLTMRETFKSSGCKVFEYTDKRFIELVKRGMQYIK